MHQGISDSDICNMYDEVYRCIVSSLCICCNAYSHDLHHDVMLKLMTDELCLLSDEDVLREAKRIARNLYCNRKSRRAPIAYIGDDELLNNLNYANDIQTQEEAD